MVVVGFAVVSLVVVLAVVLAVVLTVVLVVALIVVVEPYPAFNHCMTCLSNSKPIF